MHDAFEMNDASGERKICTVLRTHTTFKLHITCECDACATFTRSTEQITFAGESSMVKKFNGRPDKKRAIANAQK